MLLHLINKEKLLIFIIFIISKQKNHQDKKKYYTSKRKKILDFCMQGVNKKIFIYFNKKPKFSIITLSIL